MRTFIVSFLVTALVQLTNIVSGVLAARLLMPEGRGELAIAMLWPQLFAAIGSLSIDQGVMYHLASRRETAASIFSASIALAAGLSVVTMVVGFFTIPYLLGTGPQELLSDSRWYLLFVLINLMCLIMIAVSSGTLQFGLSNLQRAFVPIIYVMAIVVFYLGGFVSVWAFLFASLLANMALAVLGLFLQLNHSGIAPFRREVVWLVLRYSVPIHLAMLVLIVMDRLDRALISIYLPPKDLGFYVVATSVVGVVTMATGTIGLFALPKIANQPGPDAKAKLLARYLQLSVVLGLAATVVLFFASPWLIALLFGSAFEPAVPLSQILFLGAVPASLAALLATGCRASGRIAPVNYVSIVSLIVTVTMLLVLLPRIGSAGAAWAVVTVQWISFFFLLVAVNRVLGIGMRTLFVPRRSEFESLKQELSAWLGLLRSAKGGG